MTQHQRQKVAAAPVSSKAIFNKAAERAILGRILIDDRLWCEIDDKIKPEDFGVPKHDWLFKAMGTLNNATRPITCATVLSQVGEAQEVDNLSLGAYLDSLYAEASAPDSAKVPLSQYVEIIQHCASRRKFMDAADAIKSRAAITPLDVPIAELKQEAAKLIELADLSNAAEDQSIGEVVQQVIWDSETAKKTGIRPGIVTGFEPFDQLVGTMRPGNLIVIAGETGSGKTALATQLGALMATAQTPIPVRMTSLEMESAEIAVRVLAKWAEMNSEKIVNGEVDLDKLTQMGERLYEMPFWFDARPRQTVGTIQARLARAQARHGVKVGIIDHLQYVKSDLTRADHHEKVAQVVDDIKAMAKRLKMVIILLSHVSRSVELSTIRTAADVKRPFLNQLFGSSAIEKAADAVVFVHRPFWFLDRATPDAKHKAECEADKLIWANKAELVLPKRRSGKGFGVNLVWFDEEQTWFREMRDGWE